MRWLLPLLLLVPACGEGAVAPDAAARPGTPCGTLPPADVAATLPPDLPAPAGQVLHTPASQGATRIVFAHLPGEDFVALRNQIQAELLAAGYTVDTDQEAVEAEAHFTGAHEGSVKVQRLCQGRLVLRWKLDT